jgi:hypothetical protein
LAERAGKIRDEIICEKCGTRRADREYLLFQDTIIYLCEECASMVLPLLPFLVREDTEH